MRVFCILGGERIFRSKSPAMHTGVMKRQGINGVYVPFRVEKTFIGDAIRGIRALGIVGANVTVPHKEEVILHLNKLSAEAESIGAVNTIVRIDDLLEGHNTDIGGFMDALSQAGFQAAGANVLVFGAGGASKAVVYAMRHLRAERIFLVNRNRDRARLIGDAFGAEVVPFWPPDDVLRNADLLVNATSVSTPNEAPEMAELVRSLQLENCRLVVDLNYGREDNFWATVANENGVRFMDGLPMLVHQARRSFQKWTEMDVDADDFFEALRGDG